VVEGRAKKGEWREKKPATEKEFDGAGKPVRDRNKVRRGSERQRKKVNGGE